MSTIKYNARVAQRHDTSTNWAKVEDTFIPLAGELIIYDDIYGKMRIGDGTSFLKDLPFVIQQADWNQTDSTKANFLVNKPVLGALASKDEVAKDFLAEDVQESINSAAYINATDNETITDVNIPSTGGANIDVTATVGQTIVVKEVDSNGKPTKWESADYQPRTHWSEEIVILPEITIKTEPETEPEIGLIPVEFTLETGKFYTVTYNGVEYVNCYCSELEGVRYLGNLGVLLEGFPSTQYPFLIGCAVESGAGSGACAPFDGSTSFMVSIKKNKHHTIPSEHIPLKHYIYDLDESEFEEQSGMGIDKLAYKTEIPVELVKAMHQGLPIFLRVTKNNDFGPRSYMASASWSCSNLEFMLVSIDINQETVPVDDIITLCSPYLIANMPSTLSGLETYQVRFNLPN